MALATIDQAASRRRAPKPRRRRRRARGDGGGRCCSCSRPGRSSGSPCSRFTGYMTDRRADWPSSSSCGSGGGACALIALGWRRLPRWAFQVLLALGTLVITRGTYFASARPDGRREMFYIWVALYAAYFFSRRQAAASDRLRRRLLRGRPRRSDSDAGQRGCRAG